MPSFPIYIQGYGTANFNSGAERDVYQTFIDLFTPVAGIYQHTNMDSEVRMTKNNPMLNADIDEIGLPRVYLVKIPIADWNATYPQGVSPVIDMEDKFVDRVSPHFDKENYYQNNLPACGDPCEVIYIRGDKVYMLVLATMTTTLLITLPTGGQPSIASTGGRFYVSASNPWTLEEYTINYSNCSASHSRTITVPIPYAVSVRGRCAKNSSVLIGGNINGDEIVEYDVSGSTAVITPLFNLSSSMPTGMVNPRVDGAIIYLPLTDELMIIELWTNPQGQLNNQVVVRQRATGTIICHTEIWPQVWGLFCHDGQTYGMKYDTNPGSRGVFQIMYNPGVPVITFSMAFIAPDYGLGASSDPSCCGTTVVSVPTIAGYACTDSNGNSVGTCTNATPICNGNNSDGRFATVLECLANCPVVLLTCDLDITDSNGIVVNQISGMTFANFFSASTQFNGFAPGTYTVRYYNILLNGTAHNDINVQAIVLGDTPWTCATHLMCCPPMWNCVNCNCYQVIGAGTYSSLSACLANCCVPPVPAEDDCSDFDVCIPCDDTLIY